jgi:nucleoside 2-deoxyribosyltransferase
MHVCLVGSMRNLARMRELGKELELRGHKVTLPVDMSESGFTDRHKQKSTFMRTMFDEIKVCDAILAVNDETRQGYEGYIGANTFLELGMGYALGKQLFSLERWDSKLPYDEELRAMDIAKLDIHQKV